MSDHSRKRKKYPIAPENSLPDMIASRNWTTTKTHCPTRIYVAAIFMNHLMNSIHHLNTRFRSQ
jgi:hypothetical protein